MCLLHLSLASPEPCADLVVYDLMAIVNVQNPGATPVFSAPLLPPIMPFASLRSYVQQISGGAIPNFGAEVVPVMTSSKTFSPLGLPDEYTALLQNVAPNAKALVNVPFVLKRREVDASNLVKRSSNINTGTTCLNSSATEVQINSLFYFGGREFCAPLNS